MKNCNTYIVHNGVRYRLVKGLDCTNHCSFRKADGPYYCERGCYLPSWFKRLRIGIDCWLERVDQIDASTELYEALSKAVPWLADIGEEVVGIESAACIAEIVKEAKAALANAAGEIEVSK